MAGLPLYHRIYTVLIEQIREGQYPPGATLPGELELAQQFDVSRVTIRKTLDQLERDGLVERRQGRGTFVRAGRATEPVKAEVTGLVENLLAMGLRTKVKVLHFAYEPAPRPVAERLEIPVGTIALHSVRLRSYKGEPFSYAVTWLPESIGRTFGRKELSSMPLTRLLVRAGAAPAEAHQKVFARAASATVAPLLELSIGAPLLGIERTVRDVHGRPVEHLRALYRPDRYAFELTMHIQSNDPDALWEPTALKGN
ncbi:GntR family transcriptional regulator [Algihabitans albus]|uniref:GntR family transcriptional regulator n=1 Tax=Algihabitans albus TaxID=2164067 RepID=UPI000E5D4029|nr:GntR family transcriptional regulator [Algihabitans albus]